MYTFEIRDEAGRLVEACPHWFDSEEAARDAMCRVPRAEMSPGRTLTVVEVPASDVLVLGEIWHNHERTRVTIGMDTDGWIVSRDEGGDWEHVPDLPQFDSSESAKQRCFRTWHGAGWDWTPR